MEDSGEEAIGKAIGWEAAGKVDWGMCESLDEVVVGKVDEWAKGIGSARWTP